MYLKDNCADYIHVYVTHTVFHHQGTETGVSCKYRSHGNIWVKHAFIQC